MSAPGVSRIAVSTLLLAGALGMESCTDAGNVSAPRDDEIATALEELGPAYTLQTAPGVVVNSRQMEAQLTRLTRSVALSLGRNAAVRGRVRSAVSVSKFAEGKLEFKALVDDAGFGLRAEMARESGTTPGRIRSALDSLPALELYLPVDAHRDSWEGEPNLIVASLLDDDSGSSISAFDLSGRPVALSLDEPPDQPVLVLVPAETDFSPDTGTGPALVYDDGPGIYMTSNYLVDTHEPWIHGDPELAVHVAIADVGGILSSQFEFASCAGDNQTGIWNRFYFDQNDNSWSGVVKIADLSTILDGKTSIQVWEDDFNRCSDGTQHVVPHTQPSWLAVYALIGSILHLGAVEEGTMQFNIYGFVAGLTFTYAFGLIRDDFVGETKALTQSCFATASGPVLFQLKDEYQDYAGFLRLDNTEDMNRELCAPTPLQVTISGPTEAPENNGNNGGEGDVCTWEAIATGGSGAKTYAWTYDWAPVGNGSSWSGDTGSSGDHDLRVTVMDASGNDSDELQIQVTEFAECFS